MASMRECPVANNQTQRSDYNFSFKNLCKKSSKKLTGIKVLLGASAQVDDNEKPSRTY